MIDSVTGQRVVVLTDSIYGPYVRISSFQDSGALEDVLDDELHVPYWTHIPEDFKDSGGRELFFGWVADVEKLQKIIDQVGVDWS